MSYDNKKKRTGRAIRNPASQLLKSGMALPKPKTRQMPSTRKRWLTTPSCSAEACPVQRCSTPRTSAKTTRAKRLSHTKTGLHNRNSNLRLIVIISWSTIAACLRECPRLSEFAPRSKNFGDGISRTSSRQEWK